MEIVPKQGIDKLEFGMQQHHVASIYGNPNHKFEDEEGNEIVLYYPQKLRLTFYEDEDMKLGYIISSNPDLKLFDQKIIGKTPDEIKLKLESHGLKSWQQEEFDMTVTHSNEENWLTLESEFNEIVKVELGAMINENDEFEWKFNAKN
jgi:hypothetical protein